jgi:MFS transporter, DHA2 family, methylenomycin A resistance protein
MNRVGARVMLAGGMSLMGAGLLVLAAATGSAGSLIAMEVALLIIGIGLGLNTGPVNAVAVASVVPAHSGTAAGLLNTARMVGATLGIAALGAVFAVYAGDNTAAGMVTGLRFAFIGGAVAELIGAAIAVAFTRPDSMEARPR